MKQHVVRHLDKSDRVKYECPFDCGVIPHSNRSNLKKHLKIVHGNECQVILQSTKVLSDDGPLSEEQMKLKTVFEKAIDTAAKS